ncbi:Phage conserved hypothetical protein [uncultured Caudovirales phage]|uniref:Gp6 domain containing protein n=1 Tax=uncultured Caudovirales phage TaxID=2100421 RepID=A0A6J5QGS4_9CAUD|nr:Phage conserved hypothetical protein [uncultured Caudovirales phage]CAB4176234.1 Phage conserved hypothetical protein [uncultured Caudovirales phage]CAB4181556.1 Phage conserved hypothetical protein [uncultured Caudovirales phage]CAB4197363.1 Phage conserved hypothetical protein [uncultured Caudovirales phage]CAB4210944.1 Phage conserved hypothetical protein [uncultured Caudovirales phage]
MPRSLLDYRSLVRVTQPTVEPISISEAKAQIRIDDTSQDLPLLATYISAAREWAESYTERTFIHTQWQLRTDAFPWEFRLPFPPMARSAGFTDVTLTYTSGVVNSVGTIVTLDSAKYRVDREQTPGGLRPLYGSSWPGHIIDENGVNVTWWAGYGEDGTKIPKAIKPALLMLVAHLFRNREMTVEGSLSIVPMGVRQLLNTVRWGGY